MEIQIFLVVVFTVNQLLLWKFNWYYRIGLWLFLIIPLIAAVLPQPRFELDYFWWRIAGMAAIAAGTGLFFWARSVFRPDELITSGPYQYLRHPMYLGLIFIFVGWWWIWAAVYSFYFGMFMLAMIWLQGCLEEKLVLEKKFGGRFRDYRSRTGMFWIK